MSQLQISPGVLALVVIIGAFSYLIVRGATDVAGVAIVSSSLSVVLSYFFADHIANGAADKALASRIANNALEAADLKAVLTPAPHDPPPGGTP